MSDGELPLAPQPRLRFECTQCGKCCTTRGEYVHVYLNRHEVRALAELLHMSTAACKRRYTFLDEDGWRELKFTKESCVFLDERGQCSVYDARPTQCRTFPFWREFANADGWTEPVRELCEGVDRGREYSEEESELMMIEMELSGEAD